MQAGDDFLHKKVKEEILRQALNSTDLLQRTFFHRFMAEADEHYIFSNKSQEEVKFHVENWATWAINYSTGLKEFDDPLKKGYTGPDVSFIGFLKCLVDAGMDVNLSSNINLTYYLHYRSGNQSPRDPLFYPLEEFDNHLLLEVMVFWLKAGGYVGGSKAIQQSVLVRDVELLTAFIEFNIRIPNEVSFHFCISNIDQICPLIKDSPPNFGSMCRAMQLLIASCNFSLPETIDEKKLYAHLIKYIQNTDKVYPVEKLKPLSLNYVDKLLYEEQIYGKVDPEKFYTLLKAKAEELKQEYLKIDESLDQHKEYLLANIQSDPDKQLLPDKMAKSILIKYFNDLGKLFSQDVNSLIACQPKIEKSRNKDVIHLLSILKKEIQDISANVCIKHFGSMPNNKPLKPNSLHDSKLKEIVISFLPVEEQLDCLMLSKDFADSPWLLTQTQEEQTNILNEDSICPFKIRKIGEYCTESLEYETLLD